MMFVKLNYDGLSMIYSLNDALNKGRYCRTITDYNFVMIDESEYLGYPLGFLEACYYEPRRHHIVHYFNRQKIIFVWSYTSDECDEGVLLKYKEMTLVPKEIYQQLQRQRHHRHQCMYFQG